MTAGTWSGALLIRTRRNRQLISLDGYLLRRSRSEDCSAGERPFNQFYTNLQVGVTLMKKVKATLVLVALSVSIQAYAQGTKKVEGVVTDQNGAPISGAEVTFAGKVVTVNRTTDAEGRFDFDVQDDTAMVTIGARGFETASRVWNVADRDSSRLRITLAAEGLSEQMTVTASRTEARVSDTPARVTVLSATAL